MFNNIANIATRAYHFKKGNNFCSFSFSDKLVFMVNYIVAVRCHTIENYSSIHVPEGLQSVCVCV